MPMSAGRATFVSSYSAIVDALKTYDGTTGKTQEEAKIKMANDLADAIIALVQTATVTTPLGVAVQVVPATGTGATTAPGTGTVA